MNGSYDARFATGFSLASVIGAELACYRSNFQINFGGNRHSFRENSHRHLPGLVDASVNAMNRKFFKIWRLYVVRCDFCGFVHSILEG